MKKLYTAALLLMCNPFLSEAQSFSQYFDGDDTAAYTSIQIHIDSSSANVWQIGKPQKPIFDNASTQPNAIVTDTINFYPANNISRFRTTVPSNSWGGAWGIFALQWVQKLDLDQGLDGGIIEFSADSGTTWQNAFNNPYVYNFYGFDPSNEDTLPNGEYAFSGTDTTWKNVWLCFDVSWMSLQTDSIHFRFTLKSDSIDNGKEGWMIDNMLAHLTWIHTVNETKQEKYMQVGPNPTRGKIDISTKKLDQFHIIEHMELINIEGKVVEQWSNTPTKFQLDISRHPKGIYFLKVKTNIQSETFKIVLEP